MTADDLTPEQVLTAIKNTASPSFNKSPQILQALENEKSRAGRLTGSIQNSMSDTNYGTETTESKE